MPEVERSVRTKENLANQYRENGNVFRVEIHVGNGLQPSSPLNLAGNIIIRLLVYQLLKRTLDVESCRSLGCL
jgi:hypothetical protein